MRIVSFSEARNRLKTVLDTVVNDTDITIITRKDAADAVVMSLDYYNSLMETLHLSRSPANAEHLSRSIEQYRARQSRRAWPMTDRLLRWNDAARVDCVYWQGLDRKTLKQINKLIHDVQCLPFEDIGKSEPSMETLSGFRSRRMDDTNRLVYSVDAAAITIISCHYHY